nr:MAG TPA: hypothetical protein [Caudoviricetes sp.]
MIYSNKSNSFNICYSFDALNLAHRNHPFLYNIICNKR